MADEKTPDEGEESTTEVDATEKGPEDTKTEAETDTEVVATEPAEDYDVETKPEAEKAEKETSVVKLAAIAGLVLVLALGGLTGWLGYRAYESRQAEDLRNLFLQVGRQGALNLTTINHETAEQDVQRILESATGTFYDDFQARSQPFVQVVKQAQAKSEGSVTEAALESEDGNAGQVLVAVTVKTSNAGAPEQQPRYWRMRLTVEKIGDEAKVSNVEFVP